MEHWHRSGQIQNLKGYGVKGLRQQGDGGCDGVPEERSRKYAGIYDQYGEKYHWCRGNILYRFCICNVYFAAERKVGKTGEKSVICICQKGKGRGCAGGSCIDIQDILQFSDGTVCRGSDPGIFVRDCDDAA